MQLSVEVNNLSDTAVLVCRGQILQGEESEYLFALATRPDQRDVILDVGAVSEIDDAGLLVIVLCYRLISADKRRLFLRNPSSDFLAGLRRQQTNALATHAQVSATNNSNCTVN